MLHYLARYTHWVAISHHRLLAVSDTSVAFRWTDYAHRSRQRTMTLSPDEFLRRFVQHVLSRGNGSYQPVLLNAAGVHQAQQGGATA